VNAVDDGCRGRCGVADEAKVIAEAEGEGLVVGFEDLVEECLDVFLVFFDEFFLASAFVDDEPNAERNLVIVGEEANLCGTPSSTTVKSSWVRPVTMRPSASRTLRVVSMRWVSILMTGRPCAWVKAVGRNKGLEEEVVARWRHLYFEDLEYRQVWVRRLRQVVPPKEKNARLILQTKHSGCLRRVFIFCATAAIVL